MVAAGVKPGVLMIALIRVQERTKTGRPIASTKVMGKMTMAVLLDILTDIINSRQCLPLDHSKRNLVINVLDTAGIYFITKSNPYTGESPSGVCAAIQD
jgi:hypothetical protein